MYIKKIAVSEDNRIYPIEDLNRSFHNDVGCIDREDLIKNNHDGVIPTTTGHKMLLTDANFKDNYDRMKKSAAIIIPKDIGYIIAETALTKDSVVIDSGSGSGGSTCMLGALCKKVYSYDINPAHIKTTKENCKRLDLDNVEVIEEDITKIEPKEKVDVMVIDIPNPVEALATAKKALKQGGYIVFYTPHINQAQEIYKHLDNNFKFITTIEMIQRRWEVDDIRLRPKHNMLGHTAFLTFIRLFKR